MAGRRCSSRYERTALRTALVWCGLAASLSTSVSAPASPADTFGLGSRSTAMGGAVTGRVSDASANYYNPSGLVLGEHTQLSLGYFHRSPQFSVGGRDAELSSLDAYEAGLVVPGKIAQLPLAFGLIGHLTSNRLARISTYAQDDRRWFIYDTRPEQVFIAANLAVAPVSWLTLGAGFGFLTSTQGSVTVSGTVRLPGRDTTEYDSQLQHEVMAELSSVRYAMLGATLLLADDLDIGVSYRGQGSVSLDVDSNIRGELDYTFVQVPVDYALQSRTVASFVPRQLTLGARWGLQERFDLHLDVSWVDWSPMPSPLSATSARVSIEEPQGLDIEVPMLPPDRPVENAGLTDRVVPRLGAEFRSADDLALTWAVRAGYAFQASPVVGGSSDQLVDSDLHVVSVGAGAGILDFGAERGALQLDGHLQCGLTADRTLRASDESRLEAAGRFLAAGLTLGLRL